MGYKVHFLLDNVSHYSYSPQTNIFIGTPTEIENCLLKTGTTFNYAVFDEKPYKITIFLLLGIVQILFFEYTKNVI